MTDAVIAGIGIVPEVELARSAGLAVDNGIVVDEFLLSTDPTIYAAGDVANFYSPRWISGCASSTKTTPMPWAKPQGETWPAAPSAIDICLTSIHLFDLRYEAVGVSRCESRYRRGLEAAISQRRHLLPQDDRVRGVLLWNTRGRNRCRRRLIQTGRRSTAAS